MEHQEPGYAGEHAEPTFGIYRCRRCTRAVVVLDPRVTEPTCHDEPMRHVETPGRAVTREALGTALADGFGVPQSGSDVCYALLVNGLSSIDDIATRIDRDSRSVRRHLQRLVAADLLDRSELPREDGGAVAVYHPPGPDRGRPETLAEFCVWATRAAGDEHDDGADHFGSASAVFREVFCAD